MGALASKNFSEMLDEDPSPPTPSVSKRVLDEALDPRSPTCGIVRTPIQVLKTPEFVNDPRSPTVGIDRTPICTKFSPKEVKEISNQKEEDVDLNTVVPLNMCELLEEMESIQSEADQPTTTAENCSALCQAPVNSDQLPSKSKPNLEKKSRKPKSKVIGHTNSDSDVVEGKQAVRSPLKVLGDRSPLTSRNRDYNSPRAIVQRKQASKIVMKKPVLQISGGRNSPVKYRTMAEDKENL